MSGCDACIRVLLGSKFMGPNPIDPAHFVPRSEFKIQEAVFISKGLGTDH